MIVTIINQEDSSADGISAYALAERRAHAGRNVLLLSQNILREQGKQYKASPADAAWMLTEMKAGATARTVAAKTLAVSLRKPNRQFHDIVVDLPMPGCARAATVLASSDLLVFTIRLARWDCHQQASLQHCVSVAGKAGHAPAVLVMLDDIDTVTGRALIATLGCSIARMRFMQFARNDDLSLANVYRAVYLP